MRTLRRATTAILIALIATLIGCGEKTARPTSGDGSGNAAAVSLPEWTPEDPSPEFLRAAKVLKPLPPEMFQGMAQGNKAMETMLARMHEFWPALYELFGTLTDEQIEKFLSAKEIRIPFKSLTAKQSAALDNWFAKYREAMQGLPPELKLMEDYKIQLYREGADEDFSNVKVGFAAQQGHMVHIQFWIRKSDGSEDGPCTAFAQI
ncbi:MAG: hypothetical protein GTN69_08645 [Armatimonadetes bacterium]|nr:hypothetical protein [Armatimonadota bacterium]NIO75932.1 hypothetical protein [Armatimonadota bacterium]NIO98744.1 hypothetical protein [Armatimonadota bacterium]